MSSKHVFIGVDPGVNGYVTILRDSPKNTILEHEPLPKNESQLRDLVNDLDEEGTMWMIEEQVPRPTFFKGRSSILRSTCILYGGFQLLRGMLISYYIDYDVVLPQKWQSFFKMEKVKGEKDTGWKRRLWENAQKLFPGKYPVKAGDSVLLALYCRYKWGKS